MVILVHVRRDLSEGVMCVHVSNAQQILWCLQTNIPQPHQMKSQESSWDVCYCWCPMPVRFAVHPRRTQCQTTGKGSPVATLRQLDPWLMERYVLEMRPGRNHTLSISNHNFCMVSVTYHIRVITTSKNSGWPQVVKFFHPHLSSSP
jgi:hypothetical protein